MQPNGGGFGVSIRSFLVYFLILLAVTDALLSESIVVANDDDTTNKQKQHQQQQNPSSTIRKFRSFQSDVYVVSNFLPLDLALDWRSRMNQAWEATSVILENGKEQCSNTGSSDNIKTKSTTETCASNFNNGTFLYATNNNGIFTGRTTNAKVRSMTNVQKRNRTAHFMRSHGMFSYAKWELPPDHELVQEMERYFASSGTIEKVTKIISRDHPDVELQPDLSDMFVTFYSQGDFLSPHSDGASGTWAFVLSLTETETETDWNKDMGGVLRFQCPYEKGQRRYPISWCEYLVPNFNSIALFQTRLPNGGVGPEHEVLPVTVAPESGFYRFGLTGWYMDGKDTMPDSVRLELEKMRGRD